MAAKKEAGRSSIGKQSCLPYVVPVGIQCRRIEPAIPTRKDASLSPCRDWALIDCASRLVKKCSVTVRVQFVRGGTDRRESTLIDIRGGKRFTYSLVFSRAFVLSQGTFGWFQGGTSLYTVLHLKRAKAKTIKTSVDRCFRIKAPKLKSRGKNWIRKCEFILSTRRARKLRIRATSSEDDIGTTPHSYYVGSLNFTNYKWHFLIPKNATTR